jgi:hypothetical protein
MEWGMHDGAGYVIIDSAQKGRVVVFKSDNRSDTEQEAERLNKEHNETRES